MLNWLFKNRSAERRDVVRSAAELVRDRRNIGLWNDPVPDYSRTAPSPMIRNRARYLATNSAVAARAAQAFIDNVVGPGITLLPKINGENYSCKILIQTLMLGVGKHRNRNPAHDSSQKVTCLGLRMLSLPETPRPVSGTGHSV